MASLFVITNCIKWFKTVSHLAWFSSFDSVDCWSTSPLTPSDCSAFSFRFSWYFNRVFSFFRSLFQDSIRFSWLSTESSPLKWLSSLLSRCFLASFLLVSSERLSWHFTHTPEGRWRRNTAFVVLLTDWPPGPLPFVNFSSRSCSDNLGNLLRSTLKPKSLTPQYRFLLKRREAIIFNVFPADVLD